MAASPRPSNPPTPASAKSCTYCGILSATPTHSPTVRTDHLQTGNGQTVEGVGRAVVTAMGRPSARGEGAGPVGSGRWRRGRGNGGGRRRRRTRPPAGLRSLSWSAPLRPLLGPPPGQPPGQLLPPPPRPALQPAPSQMRSSAWVRVAVPPPPVPDRRVPRSSLRGRCCRPRPCPASQTEARPSNRRRPRAFDVPRAAGVARWTGRWTRRAAGRGQL